MPCPPFRSRLATLVLPTLLLSALAGCTTTSPPQPSFPELTYGHLDPIRLDVARIEVTSTYTPTLRSPHVEHLMAEPPQQAARRWARDRLQAAAGAGRTTATARFVIVTAAVIEVPLETNQGLRGLFTTEQGERYDAELAVRIEIYDGGGVPAAQVTAKATHSRTVAEDATLNEREAVWFELVDSLMRDLNVALEQNIATYLSPYTL